MYVGISSRIHPPPSPPPPPDIHHTPAVVRPARAHVVYPTPPPAHLPGGTLGVIGGAQTAPHPAQRGLHPPPTTSTSSGRNPGAPGLSAKDGIACATAPQKAASALCVWIQAPPICPFEGVGGDFFPARAASLRNARYQG
jgi:hypothetical protein